MAVIKPKKVDLLTPLKGTAPTVDLSTFKLSVLGLFSDTMNEDTVDTDTKGRLARLRARIEIELKDF